MMAPELPAWGFSGVQMSPSRIQKEIAEDARATRRVCRYLDQRGVEHSGQISGATLAAVCGVNGRQWRRWVAGEPEMPTGARRLLALVSGIDCE